MKQPFYKKAGVQGAIVAGVFLLLATIITVYYRGKISEPGISNMTTVSGGTNSFVNQMDQSSNSRNNNSGNVTIGDKSTSIYQGGTNNLQQIQFAPNGIPVYTPNATIGNLTINYGGVDTQIQARVLKLEMEVDMESNVTKQDILDLTKMIRDLDKRTEDIHRLPDGRTSLGDVIAIGGTTSEDIDYSNGISSFIHGDFSSALTHFKKINEDLESAPHFPSGFEIVSINSGWKSGAYYVAAMAAQRLGSNELANSFAEKSINFNPTPEGRVLLSTTLGNLGVQRIREGNFTNAFELIHKAITNYEAIETSSTNNITRTQVSMLYGLAAWAAFNVGKTNEAVEYAEKSSNMMTDINVLTNKP